MIDIKFQVDGRSVRPNEFTGAIERSVCQAIEDDIREKLGGVRDPDTGEFPTIALRGHSLDAMSIEVSGSPEIVKMVEDRLNDDYNITAIAPNAIGVGDAQSPPQAFLCHGSEDKPLARKIAAKLQASGIDTFFDEWEIRSGDSIRQKIDSGLSGCTHFLALITETSILKPWVNAEIDAAFVQKIDGRCRFIPLRANLSAERLPPLLASLHAPSIEDFDPDIERLVADILGISDKPALGPPPSVIRNRSAKDSGLSAGAELIVRLMIEKSEYGLSMDPQITAEDLKISTELPDDDLIDAVYELSSRGFIRENKALGMGSLGFIRIVPEAALFSALDRYFTEWIPEQDALVVATYLLNSETDGKNVGELAEKLKWAPRRMNPALNFLIERRLVDSSKSLGTHPWCTHWVRRTPDTRRWVRASS